MEMKKYVIDFTSVDSAGKAHGLIKKSLDFPEYYGGNLDALYDCLSDLPACEIELCNVAQLGALGVYKEKLLSVFRDAEQDFGNIHVIF